MQIYNTLDSFFSTLSNILWGTPLIILLLGGGLFFAIYSRMIPILYFKHAIEILLGKYDSKDDPGQITHFEALSSALAGTVGMGNIAGVAVAINTGVAAEVEYSNGVAIFTKAIGGLMLEASIGGQKFSFSPVIEN